MNGLLHKLREKQNKLAAFRPFPRYVIKNLDDWFNIELTYTSNAIEGNTLTRQETALVVEKGITIGGKSLNEHLEAINHAQALEFIKSLSGKKRQDITEKDLLGIHHVILSKIDDTNAGRYRNVPVRIAGSTVIMPNPLKVPNLMADFMTWLQMKNDNHPVHGAAEAHFKLVSIHPFIDGNGRTARLLMNLLLIQEGYPPAIIKKEDRLKYINAIEKGQLSGCMDDYYQIIYESVERSLDIYLQAIGQQEPQTQRTKKQELEQPVPQKLLKIGELAKLTGENVPTIRYWTQQGLLDVADYTGGGYQLYSELMIDRAKKIRQLQKEKRLTLQEIKEISEL